MADTCSLPVPVHCMSAWLACENNAAHSRGDGRWEKRGRLAFVYRKGRWGVWRWIVVKRVKGRETGTRENWSGEKRVKRGGGEHARGEHFGPRLWKGPSRRIRALQRREEKGNKFTWQHFNWFPLVPVISRHSLCLPFVPDTVQH